jgi:hypothetical protein
MRKSLATLALAFTLPAGIAFAQPQAAIPPQVGVPSQVAVEPGQLAQNTEQSSYEAFIANVNPSLVVATTGIYDQGDAFTGRHGFPLEGWSQVRLPYEN